MHTLSFPSHPDTVYTLQNGTYTLGKHESNSFVLDDPSISDHHAVLILRDHQSTLQDLKTPSGTYLNGSLVQSTPITIPTHSPSPSLLQFGSISAHLTLSITPALPVPPPISLSPQSAIHALSERIHAEEKEETPPSYPFQLLLAYLAPFYPKALAYTLGGALLYCLLEFMANDSFLPGILGVVVLLLTLTWLVRRIQRVLYRTTSEKDPDSPYEPGTFFDHSLAGGFALLLLNFITFIFPVILDNLLTRNAMGMLPQYNPLTMSTVITCILYLYYPMAVLKIAQEPSPLAINPIQVIHGISLSPIPYLGLLLATLPLFAINYGLTLVPEVPRFRSSPFVNHPIFPLMIYVIRYLSYLILAHALAAFHLRAFADDSEELPSNE